MKRLGVFWFVLLISGCALLRADQPPPIPLVPVVAYSDKVINSSVISDLIKGLPAALVAFVIGAIAARIAYNQYLVARAKLSLDLFEKRLPIFEQTWEVFSKVAMNGKTEPMLNFANPFSGFRPQARFLFGKDIESYLDIATRNWVFLDAFIKEKDALDGQDRVDNDAKIAELKKWFFEQASHGVKNTFGPYLDFEKWK